MTAPDPPAVASVGAQAVEAAAMAMRAAFHDPADLGWMGHSTIADSCHECSETRDVALAAALPHLRAQVLAEVDAALRDEDALIRWSWSKFGHDEYVDTNAAIRDADYLRDTLAGDGGEA